ncbi:MAG: methylenetetrahydrofolate reductase [Dehalococcoidia bacterium]|nr:MAG: methylenetetrahydrofolate reductase [Dehalococcoidia bacterium]
MKAGTNLEKILASGKFAVTVEAGPPKGTNPEVIQKKGNLLCQYCDAVNVTDNQTAIVRMSSLASCLLLKQMGVEPVMQMATRDRNRIALQSDVLGAVAWGIGNILCLSGDHPKLGNHPQSKAVFDIDSVQLIQVLKNMRDEHKFINGDEISGEVPLFIGAVANPFADPFEVRVPRLAKKIKAGADFIQTQAVFDVSRFAQWMKIITERGLDEETHILAGIIPIRSAGMVRYMKNNVSGVNIPDDIITRMEKAEDAEAEGVKIALELIAKVKEIPGVHGIHVMAVGWEKKVPEIIERAGLLPRPVL